MEVFFITIVLAILIFALLVLVHEGGHMIAAKLCGVKVLEFAIGLGPLLVKKRIGETDYAIRALPFGGQCAMEGEDEESDNPRAFNNAAPWKRIIIAVAGVAMNFLMGFLIILCLYAPAERFVVPQIDSFMEKFTGGGEYGLQEGDIFREIDGYNIYQVGDVTTALQRGEKAPYFDIKVQRGSNTIELENVKIEPQEYEENGNKVMYYGFRFATKEATVFEKLKLTCSTSVNFVRMVYTGLADMLTGKVGLNDMSGPIGITAVMSETAKTSMPDFWYMTALIAINLAVMNLLPIPALDGGRIVFILFEMIFKKKPNKKVEGMLHIAVFFLLMGLMLVVAFNDIWKLVT